MDKDIAFDFDSGEKVSYVPNYKSKVTLIKAKGKNKYTIVHGCFEEYFEFSNKCYLFLWDIDMLKNIPKDTIRKYNIYSHRIELTLEQLDSLDWTVTVP
jgi:hypothetical protein